MATRLERRTRSLALWVTLFVLAGYALAASKSPSPDIDERIRFYSAKVSQHPRLHQAYALLAVAYIDKARWTLDPAYIAEARKALKQSLAIQSNFLAFKTRTGLSTFTHRFDEALRWGQQAAKVDPNDTEVIARLIEAYMGQGRYDEAARLLPVMGEPPRDFHTAASLGNWLASQNRYDDAIEAFMAAVAHGRAENSTDRMVWARIKAAGTLLDRGHGGLARSHLEAATSLDPQSPVVRRELGLHWAEFHEAEGRRERALAVYEALLERQNHPEIHHRAYLLGRSLDRKNRAKQHFEAAEKGFQRVIDAGEIYTLGALARLYADGEVHIEEALALAQRNLRYTRDIEANATLAYVRSKQWLPRRP